MFLILPVFRDLICVGAFAMAFELGYFFENLFHIFGAAQPIEGSMV